VAGCCEYGDELSGSGATELDSYSYLKENNILNLTKISWLMLFKEIIAVCGENHTKSVNAEYSVTVCQYSWDI
jgi:hypothetical protein